MALDKKKKTGSDEQKLIRDLALLLDETGLSEIEIQREGLKVRVARTLHVSSQVAVAPQAAGGHAAQSPPVQRSPSESSADTHAHPGAVKSPMVGTIYLAPEPGAPRFVEVGSKVSEGQTLLIIEAMKTMNHIPAPRSGVVKQVFVENEHPVEFGEPLLIIE